MTPHLCIIQIFLSHLWPSVETPRCGRGPLAVRSMKESMRLSIVSRLIFISNSIHLFV